MIVNSAMRIFRGIFSIGTNVAILSFKDTVRKGIKYAKFKGFVKTGETAIVIGGRNYELIGSPYTVDIIVVD